MKMFDVQGIEIMAPHRKVFEFVKQPGNLPHWAHAFVSAGDGRARLETPAGAVEVALSVFADAETGVVDWRLVLHAPPVALEQVEGALETQRALLRSELATLKSLMER